MSPFNTYTTKAQLPPPNPSGISPAIIERLKAVEPHRVGPRVPDLVEPIVGWRAWSFHHDFGGRLHGLGHTSAVWEPKKVLEAMCNAGHLHPAPDKGCTCGIWAFRDLDTLLVAAADYGSIRVFGQVYLWGRVLECDGPSGPPGWRAEKAYPKELWLTSPELEWLGHEYNVPVRMLEGE